MSRPVADAPKLLQSVSMRLQASIVAGLMLAGGAVSPLHASGPDRDSGFSATVRASVGHSEWCPPGTVHLNLGTGRYRVIAPRTWRTCRRPLFPTRIRTGVLAADELAAVRAAYRNAATEGLDHPACRNGGRPERMIISNSYPSILRLTERGRTTASPRELSCWSDAAFRLDRVLEGLFNPRTARR